MFGKSNDRLFKETVHSWWVANLAQGMMVWVMSLQAFLQHRCRYAVDLPKFVNQANYYNPIIITLKKDTVSTVLRTRDSSTKTEHFR